MKNKHTILIDTDPGIDDALAIFYAVGHPAIEVVGLTTIFGNAPTPITTRNALQLLEAIDKPNIPVAQGAAAPLAIPAHPPSDFVHGKEGLGTVQLPPPRNTAIATDAADFIIEQSHAHGSNLTLLMLGALTNLAIAIDKDPQLPTRVGDIVIMGGAVEHVGNVNRYAEANFWHDPHAAHTVLATNASIRLVGLDVTTPVFWDHDTLLQLAEQSPRIGKLCYEMSTFYLEFFRQYDKKDHIILHDPAAVQALLTPQLFQWRHQPLRVIVDGEQAGNVIADNRTNHHTQWASTVEHAAVAQAIFDGLASYP